MKKINVAELLHNCPSGMELDCTMFEGVEFDGIVDNKYTPIRCRIKNPDGGYNVYFFTKHGYWNDDCNAKCVIFPKGKTTWEGFQRPFKDGDIIADEHGNIAIYKGEMRHNKKLADYYCGYRNADGKFLVKKDIEGHFGHIEEKHLATEEEKEKLFKAIKDNGYKWNSETKTLVRWPKFKVGDRIRTKKDAPITLSNILITKVNECSYDGVIGFTTNAAHINFKHQDIYELDPNTNKFNITALKPFDKVLVRCSTLEKWRIQFFEKYDKTYQHPFICIGCNKYTQCIPYEGNEHLLDKTDDCDKYFKTWE